MMKIKTNDENDEQPGCHRNIILYRKSDKIPFDRNSSSTTCTLIAFALCAARVKI